MRISSLDGGDLCNDIGKRDLDRTNVIVFGMGSLDREWSRAPADMPGPPLGPCF